MENCSGHNCQIRIERQYPEDGCVHWEGTVKHRDSVDVINEQAAEILHTVLRHDRLQQSRRADRYRALVDQHDALLALSLGQQRAQMMGRVEIVSHIG